jgi:hypothetical protein
MEETYSFDQVRFTARRSPKAYEVCIGNSVFWAPKSQIEDHSIIDGTLITSWWWANKQDDRAGCSPREAYEAEHGSGAERKRRQQVHEQQIWQKGYDQGRKEAEEEFKEELERVKDEAWKKGFDQGKEKNSKAMRLLQDIKIQQGKKIHRRLIAKWHPDRNPVGAEVTMDLNELWQAVQ